jgi:hypothetical protein
MSKVSEFNGQWQKFLTVVESDVMKEIESNHLLDEAAVNMIVRREVSRWSISIHYNGAWLLALKQQYPELGKAFESILLEVRVAQPIAYTPTSPAPYVGMVFGSMLLAFPVLRWALGVSTVWQIAGGLAAATATVPIARNMWSSQQQKAVNIYIQQIRDGLDGFGSRLRNIAAQADKLQEEQALAQE